jgi:multidrug efflux pump subunit AcrA (membrane-fusion protein)
VRRTPLAALVTAAVLGLGAAGCEPSTAGIGTGEVRRANVVEVVDVPASVTARAVATLSAPADGTLAGLSVEPGATVKAGDIVAVVDSPAAQKRLADAKAALSAARSSAVRPARVDLSGVQRQLDSAAAKAFADARAAAGQITDATVRAALLSHIDAAEQTYRGAAQTSQRLITQVQRGLASVGSALSALGAAQRIQAQSAYDLAKSTVDALTLRAPIAGVVQLGGRSTGSTGADPLSQLLGTVGGGLPGGAASAAGAAGSTAGGGSPGVDDVLVVGDRVSAGTAIVTIVDVSELGLVGEVDETDVLLVAPDVTASVELDAAPGVLYEARVRTVDLLPTPSARGGVAYRVRLLFSDAPGAAGGSPAPPPPTPRPGMSAVAHLRVRTATDAVAVPASAVFTTDLGETVWLVRNGSAVRAQVRLGVQGEDLVQVLDGLTPGERVVVSGTDRVTTGLRLP